MFANIRKHQKWLWYLIAGAVIISFVWYFNPNSRYGAGSVFSQDQTVGTMNGRPIHRSEMLNCMKEAEMLYFFTRGSWPGSDEFSRGADSLVQNEARNRLLLKQKLKDLKIEATPAEVSNWMADFFGGGKGFTEADYDRVVKQLLEPKGMNEGDLIRFAKTQVGVMHLMSVAGASGRLVPPQAAEAEYRTENEQVSSDIVVFASSNYVAQVKLDPASLQGYFTNSIANYIENPKVVLTYVAFEATNANYLAEADKRIASITNLAARVDEMYQQRGTNLFTDTNGMVMSPDAAKAKIRQEIRQNQALVEARKAANDFAEELLALPGTKQVANLETLAAKKGIPIKTTEPFTQFESPKGIDLPERFAQRAFGLTVGDPFIEEPVVGSDGVYVMALKTQIPRRTPKFDEVKDKVVEDYKTSQSLNLAQAAGLAFYGKLTNGLAAGKPFPVAVAEAGEKSISLLPFSQTTPSIPMLPPKVSFSQIKNVAFSLKENETSAFTRTGDGGFVLHVNKFIPAADDQVKNALPDYLTNLQRVGQGEAFQEWFTKQMQAANLKLAGDRKSGPGGPQQEAE